LLQPIQSMETQKDYLILSGLRGQGLILAETP